MIIKTLSVALAFAWVLMYMGASTINAVGEDSCLVPVYNTAFAFPAEGGEIVRIGSQMYFVKNYLPECANAGNGGQVIRAGTNSQPDTSCIRPTSVSFPLCVD